MELWGIFSLWYEDAAVVVDTAFSDYTARVGCEGIQCGSTNLQVTRLNDTHAGRTDYLLVSDSST